MKIRGFILLKDFDFEVYKDEWLKVETDKASQEKSDIYQYVWFDIRTLPCCSIGEMIEFSDSMASDIVILNYFFW